MTGKSNGGGCKPLCRADLWAAAPSNSSMGGGLEAWSPLQAWQGLPCNGMLCMNVLAPSTFACVCVGAAGNNPQEGLVTRLGMAMETYTQSMLNAFTIW